MQIQNWGYNIFSRWTAKYAGEVNTCNIPLLILISKFAHISKEGMEIKRSWLLEKDKAKNMFNHCTISIYWSSHQLYLKTMKRVWTGQHWGGGENHPKSTKSLERNSNDLLSLVRQTGTSCSSLLFLPTHTSRYFHHSQIYTSALPSFQFLQQIP